MAEKPDGLGLPEQAREISESLARYCCTCGKKGLQPRDRPAPFIIPREEGDTARDPVLICSHCHEGAARDQAICDIIMRIMKLTGQERVKKLLVLVIDQLFAKHGISQDDRNSHTYQFNEISGR